MSEEAKKMLVGILERRSRKVEVCQAKIKEKEFGLEIIAE